MDIRALNSEADYDWALVEIAPYFEQLPQVGTPEADRFDVLATLIEAYEHRRWPISGPDPIDGLKAYMEMTGRSQADLGQLLGSNSRASEVLARRRRLSLEMIHKLSRVWRIPADLLVVPYPLVEGKRRSA
jgi:HTH-type transcriptional regulator/antitoxin HigA